MSGSKTDLDRRQPIYGASLSSVEPYATEEIPESERHGTPGSQFTLWFAANMVLAVLVSGFFSSQFGLSVWQGLSAVAVGTLGGATVMGLLAGIGAKLGVPQQIQGRGPMGFYGNFLPIILLTIFSSIGWTAVNTVFAVIALQLLIDIPFWLAAGIMFAVQAALAIWGHNLVHLMNKIATVVLAILFGAISVLLLGSADFNLIVNESAPLYIGELAGWITFAGFFFAYIMTWTPFASDFSRYLPATISHAKVAIYTGSGTFLSMMWLGGVGVLVSSTAGELDAIPALAKLTGAWAPLAMLTVVLSSLPVSAMNIYGGSLSILTINIPVSRMVAAILTAVIGYLVTLWMQTDPYGSFYDFLNILAYLVVPFSTVLLMDYYLRMRAGGYEIIRELYDPQRFVAWGFIAWIGACVISSLFWNSPLWTGTWASTFSEFGDVSYFVGMVSAALLYLLFKSFPPLMKLSTSQA